MLNRWGRKNRRPWLKSLSLRFVEGPILRHAAAMHYTSDAERTDAEAAGATAPAAVIPLGIDVEQFHSLPGPQRFLERFPQAQGRPIILFLSRLDAMKGIDLLLPAFARVQGKFPSSLLVIAGSGDEAYVKKLKALSKELGISGCILWTGHLSGTDKLSAFAAATVFTLPSYSENFGLALVEGAGGGTALRDHRGRGRFGRGARGGGRPRGGFAGRRHRRCAGAIVGRRDLTLASWVQTRSAWRRSSSPSEPWGGG